MVDSDGSLFDQVVGDMKVMAPLWEDLLLKSSKFYNVVKQTAFTGDLFLDSFQKIADAVTNSKGATRDIGVSFTKIVMRQRAVENKLKVFVGILADNFITPLQDSLDEWKKNCSQLEKDHTKDYKRLKGDLKKSVTDTCKLKKKVTKKMGSREYTEQFREAVKLSTSLQKSLEEQEKGYLRKLMIEERTRVTQFFHYYKPCMEQQLALLSDIEQLQSILEETKAQCESPYLPQIYEEVVNDYKLPDYLNFNGTRKESTSPPGSPLDNRMRFGSLSCPPTQTKIPLRRSLTTTSFNRNPAVEPPIPVSMPSSPMQCTHDMSVSSSSSFTSSSSSVDQCINNTYDTVNTEEFDGGMESCSPTSYTGDGNEESFMEQQMNSQGAVRPLSKAHASWSSIGTSDSSGIGSYNSLSSHHRSNSLSSHNRSAHMQSRNYSASECDPIETDMAADYQNIDMLRFGAPGGFHQGSTANGNQAKYATIDRSHFRRNKAARCGIGVDMNGKPRSNSVDVGGEPCANETIPNTTMVTATIDHLQNGGNNHSGDHVTTDDIALNNQKHVNQKVEMNYPKVNKYATIDRSHLRKNQAQMAAALKELELKQKTNGSDGPDHVEEYPNFPDYKMNLPKSKSNTMGRQNIYTNAKKPTIFQIFDGQNIAQNIGEKVLRRISPERPFPHSDGSNGSNGESMVSVQNGTPNGTPADIAPQNVVQNGVHNGVHLAVNGQNGAVPAEQFVSSSAPAFQQVGIPFTPTVHSSPQHATGFNAMPPPPPPMEKPALKPKPLVNSRLPPAPVVEPKPHTVCNDPEPAKPGSFAAQLQERRNSVLKKTLQ